MINRLRLNKNRNRYHVTERVKDNKVDKKQKEKNNVSKTTDKDTVDSIAAQQAQIKIQKVDPVDVEPPKWNPCLYMESYHGQTKNSGGLSSIIPNDPTAFYGDGKLNYHINKVTYSLDNYEDKLFLSFYYQNKIFNQEGLGSKYNTVLNDVGFRFKTSCGEYKGDWTVVPFFEVNYMRNDTNTKVPDLGKYDSNTFTYNTGVESLTLPYPTDNKFYQKMFSKTDLSLTGNVSYEKGSPDFELLTKGISVGINQTVLNKWYPLNLGVTYSYAVSTASSELFGASDYCFQGVDFTASLKPLSPFESLPGFVKNISLDYRHSLMYSNLDSGSYSQKSKGNKQQITMQVPVFNKYNGGSYYRLNIGARYAIGDSEAGQSQSNNETLAVGLNFSWSW